MLRFSRCRCTVFAAIFAALPFLLPFCASNPNQVNPETGHGMIEIRASIVNRPLAKGIVNCGVAVTAATQLVVEISGDDIETIEINQSIDLSRPAIVSTVMGVPVGRNRHVTIWTVASDGTVTHIDSVSGRTVNIESNSTVPIFATLIPAAGSIYLQFAGLPTAYSAIHASFTALEGSFMTEGVALRTGTRMFLSLDNIPHNTAGVLWVGVISYGEPNDTARVAVQELVFNARGDNNINLNFIQYGSSLHVDLIIYTPGVTVGWYDFNNPDMDMEETGELVITEIMWSAGTSNYFEIYNTIEDTLLFDPLIVEIIGTNRDVRHLSNVKIAPRSYLVIGRSDLSHVDISANMTNFVGTGGWIILKRSDGTVIDRVIFPGGSNSIDWPTVSGRRSVELARDKYCASANNYGKNWRVTTAGVIPGTSSDYGTPGF